MSVRKAATVLVVWCYGVGSGCDYSEERSQSDPVVTDHFIVYGGPEGQADWLEVQYRALSSELGFSLTKPVIYRFSGESSCTTASYCNNATAFELNCLSRDYHRDCPFRLAQLYADQIGIAPDFLRDGLAEVIAGGIAHSYAPERPDLFAVVEYFDDESYNAVREPLRPLDRVGIHEGVGRFVRTMMDELTLDGFLEFYREASTDREMWKRETGRSIEEWTALAASETPEYTTDRSYRLPFGECLAREIASGALEYGNVRTAPRIYSPRQPYRHRGGEAFSFFLGEASEVTLRVVASDQPYFLIEPCSEPMASDFSVGLGYWATWSVVEDRATLPPGRYFMIAGASIPTTDLGPPRPDTGDGFKVLLTVEAAR
jgi:hypothetical protein